MKMFQSKKPRSSRGLFAYRCVTRYAVFMRVKYTTTPRNCRTLYPQWRSEDIRGPWTTESQGPPPILHNLIPLTPPHKQPYSDFAQCTRLSLLCDFKYGTFSSVHISWCILEIWVPLMTLWGKWGALMTQ